MSGAWTFCIHCGAKLPEGVRFCPTCGKSLDVEGYNATPAPPATPETLEASSVATPAFTAPSPAAEAPAPPEVPASSPYPGWPPAYSPPAGSPPAYWYGSGTPYPAPRRANHALILGLIGLVLVVAGGLAAGAFVVTNSGSSNRATASTVAVVPTAADSPTPTPVPTPTPTPSVWTYSAVIADNPAGYPISSTDVTLWSESDGSITMGQGGILGLCPGCHCRGSATLFESSVECFGAKVTVGDPYLEIEGDYFASGTLLTMNKDLEWVEVSSFD
jgi:hypothetical protein